MPAPLARFDRAAQPTPAMPMRRGRTLRVWLVIVAVLWLGGLGWVTAKYGFRWEASTRQQFARRTMWERDLATREAATAIVDRQTRGSMPAGDGLILGLVIAGTLAIVVATGAVWYRREQRLAAAPAADPKGNLRS